MSKPIKKLKFPGVRARRHDEEVSNDEPQLWLSNISAKNDAKYGLCRRLDAGVLVGTCRIINLQAESEALQAWNKNLGTYSNLASESFDTAADDKLAETGKVPSELRRVDARAWKTSKKSEDLTTGLG